MSFSDACLKIFAVFGPQVAAAKVGAGGFVKFYCLPKGLLRCLSLLLSGIRRQRKGQAVGNALENVPAAIVTAIVAAIVPAPAPGLALAIDAKKVAGVAVPVPVPVLAPVVAVAAVTETGCLGREFYRYYYYYFQSISLS